MRSDLLTLHDKVIRVMKHLIADFKVDQETIKAFNTRGVLDPRTTGQQIIKIFAGLISLDYLQNRRSSATTRRHRRRV